MSKPTFFIKIETDKQELIHEVIDKCDVLFDKYGCTTKLDKDSSKKLTEEWSEEYDPTEDE